MMLGVLRLMVVQFREQAAAAILAIVQALTPAGTTGG
jgi:hypothetical protein